MARCKHNARFKDETGKRYGKWLVISQAESSIKRTTRWQCRCDCGRVESVFGNHLRNGSSTRCQKCRFRELGQKTLKNETGHQYGLLTVLERAGHDKHGVALWLCQCNCGRQKIASGHGLRSGNIHSCGCMKWRPSGDAAFDVLLKRYQKGAVSRNLPWQLSLEEFRGLIQLPCHYCGAKPVNLVYPHRKDRSDGLGGNLAYNGIDRINNDRGYEFQNCVPCCKFCNLAKKRYSYDEFLGWMRAIHERDCDQ